MYGICGERELTGEHPRPSQRLRRREARADRQRRLQPAPERRLRRAARLGLHPHQGRGPASRPGLGGRQRQVENAARDLGRARPGDLGGARRAQALRRRRRSCAGSRSTAARGSRARRKEEAERAERWAGIAEQIKADILERGVRRGGACASTTTPTRSTPRRCSRRWSASCPPTTRDPRDRATRSTRADRGRAGAALRPRGDRRRHARPSRARSRSARSGSSRRCRRSASWSGRGELCERLLVIRRRAATSSPRRSTRAAATQLGNFPQAFTHLALINAVSHVIVDELTDRRARSAERRCSAQIQDLERRQADASR